MIEEQALMELLHKDIATQDIRSNITLFEEEMAKMPNVHRGDWDKCPLDNKFADGIYVREIFIPAGTLVVGKIHKHSHPNVLLEGEVSVVTESKGVEKLVGPMSMISPPATKRIVYAHTDVRWITYHNVGEERDLNKIEDMVIAKDYAELEHKQEVLP